MSKHQPKIIEDAGSTIHNSAALHLNLHFGGTEQPYRYMVDCCIFAEGVSNFKNPEVYERCEFWGISLVGFFGWFAFLWLFVCFCLLICPGTCIKNCHFFSFLTNLEVNLQVSLLPKLEPNFAASRDLSQIL